MGIFKLKKLWSMVFLSKGQFNFELTVLFKKFLVLSRWCRLQLIFILLQRKIWSVQGLELSFISLFLCLQLLGLRIDFSILFLKLYRWLALMRVLLRFLYLVNMTDKVWAAFLREVNRSNEVHEGCLELRFKEVRRGHVCLQPNHELWGQLGNRYLIWIADGLS